MSHTTIKQPGDRLGLIDRLNSAASDSEPREYIFPFLWMHGEPQETIKEEIDAIYRANIREFCLESRTHEDFCRDKWWDDVGFILRYAKERGMRVWLLDDKFFPTGYANAYVNDHPELRRVELRMEYRDFAGPRTSTGMRRAPLAEGETYVTVTAYKRDVDSGEITGEWIDLTETVKALAPGKETFYWDVPEGEWRIFYVIRTTRAPGRPEYIDMLSAESCKAMIYGVYQPHYDHFKEYFGNTFAGFFSDEPCFANDFGDYYSILGKIRMMIPYRDDICALIADKINRSGAEARLTSEEVRVRLPELFKTRAGGEQRMLRWAYMDVVSQLYRDNFSSLLGNWSREHGVQYIGHIIEDNNTHQRLGHGPGHYFRAIGPQDMAGIDIVLNQYIPGMTELYHSTVGGFGYDLDPEFFNYLLPALPSSLARLNPAMDGRAMCEIFGAFGWAEGVPSMKKMLDHMLAWGINHFVPHAFSPKFPDPDCPPHFYGRGNIAQAGAFGDLMRYMSRLSHVLSGGNYIADFAVLYNAEAEWCGGRCETLQRTAKIIDRAHVAYDIVWEDILDEFDVRNGRAKVRGREYSALIVPESPYLPPELLAKLEKLSEAGLKVVVHGNTPPKNAENSAETNFKCYSDEQLPGFLLKNVSENGYVRLSKAAPLLKAYKKTDAVTGGNAELIFLCSDDDFRETRVTMTLSDDRPRRFYDAWDNAFYTPRQCGRELEVMLPPAGAIVIVTDDRPARAYDYRDGLSRPAGFECETVTVIAPDGTSRTADLRPGQDVTEQPGFENFHGIIRYEGTVNIAEGDRLLRISEVGEIVTAVLDGFDLGTKLERDCAFDVSGFAPGNHRLTLNVVNNPAHMISDPFSAFMPISRSGLVGEIRLEGTSNE